MSSENLKEVIFEKRSKEELQRLIRVCLEENDLQALVLQMINSLKENGALTNQKEVQKEIVRKLKENGVLSNLLENVRSRIRHQEVGGSETSTGDWLQNNPEERRAQQQTETSTCRCKMVYPECTTAGPSSSSEHQKSSPEESEYSSHEHVEQNQNPPTVTKIVNPRRRYLHFEIGEPSGFLKHMSRRSKKVPFMFYVHFRKQRFWTKPTPIEHFADFKTGFLLELHSDEMGPFQRASGDEILRMNDRINLVLVKVMAMGYRRVVFSTFIEWRFLLMAEKSEGSWTIDVHGVGAERQILLGKLKAHFTLIPALPEPIPVLPYLRIEDTAFTKRQIVFFQYAKDWLTEFQGIRLSFKKRNLKMFCSDENGMIRPVFDYVRPLEVGRPILETPREAAWFVSLIEFDSESYMGLNSLEQWWNPHTFLALKRGGVEHHALLLCSLLLGFGMEAYVCVGTKDKEPWMWVLTVGSQKSTVIFWESTTGGRFSHENPTDASDDLPDENRNYPYSQITCIFNHKSFYANIQDTSWVSLCKFHLEDPRLWKPMSPAAIQSVAGDEQGIQLQPGLLDPIMYDQDMERELRHFITEYRLDHKLTTRWNMELHQLLGPVLASYEMEHKCGLKLAQEEIRELMSSAFPTENTVMAVPMHVPDKDARCLFRLCIQHKLIKELLLYDFVDVEFAIKVHTYVYPENIFSVWVHAWCFWSTFMFVHWSFNTVIKPEGLYGAETLDLTSRGLLEQLEKKERKILRKILGPRYVGGQWRLRLNKELYTEVEGIVESMKKRHIQFYGHLIRMNEERLTRKLLAHFEGKKIVPRWFMEIRTDMEKMGIDQNVIKDRNHFRQLVSNFEGFREQEKKSSSVVFSEERKKISHRMKLYWQKIKANGGKR